MKNIIERYIYDVTRRLPEKERNEVSKELNSNIYDMLSDDADEHEIKEVLYKMGPPASLAEKYRQNPGYLISPAVFDDYVRVLKWLLPLVGVILLVTGMALGVLDEIEIGAFDGTRFIKNIMSKGITMGVSGVLQVLIWTTIGFAVSERVGDGTKTKGNKENNWKIEDLPEPMPNNKEEIPLSDSLTKFFLTIAFSAIAIMFCSGVGVFPVYTFKNFDTQIIHVFSSDFLTSCIPAIAVMGFFGICECIARIRERRWTVLVCSVTILNSLISMAISLYLTNRSDLFSADFMSFLQSKEWGSFDLLRFAGTGGINPIIIFISIIIVVSSVAECVYAIYKTLKNQK